MKSNRMPDFKGKVDKETMEGYMKVLNGPLWSDNDSIKVNMDEPLRFAFPKGLSLEHLTQIYELCCEEYRRRLCVQWDIRVDNTWWIADVVGDELAFDDEFVLSMVEVKHCVENAVTYEEFDEYWRFVMDEAEDGRDRPRINFNSWFRGLRPEILSLAEARVPETKIPDCGVSPEDRPADAHVEDD